MQLVTSNFIKFFNDRFKRKFNFSDYESDKKPTLFLGVYSNHDTKLVERHKGVKIVLLNGSDSSRKGNVVRAHKSGAHLIAGSKWVEADLHKFGITDYTKIPFIFTDIYDWKSEPLGDAIYWYGGGQTKYGKQHVKAIRNAFPDTEVIITDSTTYNKKELYEIYKRSFIGIRMVEHDGMSQTVAEMGLMGRVSIWNGEVPFSTSYRGINHVIGNIRSLKGGYNHELMAKRARGFLLDGERAWCNLILELCGLDELDSTGILEEAEGRCGSIFRLQRKSDIDKIGGLGTKQFERPWFSDKMKELGKKQLITSKNSGFIATEWKSRGNKGYKDGFKPRTYDEKYG